MGNKTSNSGCLITALKILGIIILIPFLIVFGWIGGIVWLLFFRKKLNDNPQKQKKTTIIVSVLSVLSLFFMIYSFATNTPLKSIQISSDVNGQELDINQDYIIDVTYEPEDATISGLTYNVDNTCATLKKSDDDNKKAILHTNSEGIITISISKGEINSNFLEFTITDRNKDADTKDSDTEKVEKDNESEEPESEEPPKTINDDVDIQTFGNVQNDVTGNWRLARVATEKEIQKYALEYCNSYFQSDNEIHAIVNFTLNTTNRLEKITSDILTVSVYDYVDKEELDAKILFSGTPLANYEINISTGEITEIPLEAEEPEEASSINPDTSAETTNDIVHDDSPETNENTEMVWLSATGEKYHSIPNCGRMNPNTARQVTKDEAIASGHAPCSKCF